MSKKGRPDKYKTNVEPHLNKIKEMCLTMTEEQIAATLGVSYSAFRTYKNKYPALNKALTLKYFVYKHTAPNGKIYIGITAQKPLKRWDNGNGYRHNDHFNNAIVKYGWENFKHEILFEGLTKDEACLKEIELIEQYKSNQREYGYNLSTGGECGAVGVKRSAETREKMSKAKQGKKLTEEERINRLQAKRAKDQNSGKRYSLIEILDHLEDIEKWAANGETDETIAGRFGITRQTFWRYKKDNINIFNAIKNGRCHLVDDLRSALVEKAKGFKYEEEKIIEENGEIVRREIYRKAALPDVAALNLLLKNYDKDNWANDPAILELKKEELEFKKIQFEKLNW